VRAQWISDAGASRWSRPCQSRSWRGRQEIKACPGRRDECEPAGKHAVVLPYRGVRKGRASGAVAGVVSPQFTCPQRNTRISCEGGRDQIENSRMKLHRTECLAVKTAGVTVQKGNGIKLRREDGVWESQSAFNSMLTNYTIENIGEIHDPKVFLESKRRIIRDIIKQDLHVKYSIKMNMSLRTIIENTDGETSKWAFTYWFY
jgi:hypothetical protein